LISGTFPVHQQLEKELASWYQKECALLFNSGYHAGIGVIPAIAQEGIIFSDELNHASLIDGCRLSRADIKVFRHGNFEHLESLLKTHTNRFPRWIASESIFGMEGEKTKLRELVHLKNKYDAALFLDEAHAIGVYGTLGRGLAEEMNLLSEIDLILGTFSKACGSFGGFAVGSEKLLTYIRNVARSFIFTTALPPAIAAVNRQAIALVRGMESERQKLRETGREVRSALRKHELEVRGDDSPIIPIILGSAERAIAFSETLLGQGIWIQPIRPPTVPPETSRLRITLSASHTKEEYEKLLRTFTEITYEQSYRR
jgi:8-amino-7-oxononanoate synthase